MIFPETPRNQGGCDAQHEKDLILGKDEVTGSIPVGSSTFSPLKLPKIIRVAVKIAVNFSRGKFGRLTGEPAGFFFSVIPA